MKARLTFGSVCSGIEAASVAWHPLGWQAAWLAEIEPFPCAVLAHHYPDVPNLGDMTTLPARIASGEVDAPDVLCGGTPCQSWSVAGKRGGADDPRGQLTFSFLRIAEVSKPRFIVWENVPGILSVDKGRPFCQFLDGLLALGYVVNCDILDAQFFGLAQRRRRVFVVCQHASFLMKEKSNISVTIGAIAVLGILQNILAALHQESGSSPEKLAAKCANVRDGLERKIKCFSVQSEEILQTWLQNLAEAFLSAATDREYWELNLGPGTKTAANSSQSVGTQLSVFQDETASRSLCLSTSQSWKSELEDLFSALKSFTTLTELKAITAQKICIYAEMLHTIGWFIAQSKESCPHLLRLESLHSTLTKEFTKYARQADEPFFRGERFFGFWDDFSSKARASIGLVASARKGFDPATVLFEWDGVRRDTAPSREARQVAPTIPARSTAGGGLGTDFDCDGGTICVATGQAGAEIGADMAPTLNCNHEAPYVAHSLRGEGFDASEDGTGRGTPWVPVAMINMQGSKGNAVAQADGPSFTLNAMHGHDMHAVAVPVGVTIHGTDPTVQKVASYDELAQCLRARTPGNIDNSSTTVVQQPVAYGIRTANTSSNGWGVQEECTHTLDCAQGVAVAQPIAFDTTQITSAANRSNPQPGDPCHPLAAGAHAPAIAFPANLSGTQCASAGDVAPSMGAANPTAVGVFYAGQGAKAGSIAYSADVAPTLKASDSGTNRVPSAHIGMRVRRLTPTEAERLQGFEPGYTAIPWRGKPADQCPDGPRYRALGNSWAIPVVRWIGRRIYAVHAVAHKGGA